MKALDLDKGLPQKKKKKKKKKIDTFNRGNGGVINMMNFVAIKYSLNFINSFDLCGDRHDPQSPYCNGSWSGSIKQTGA